MRTSLHPVNRDYNRFLPAPELKDYRGPKYFPLNNFVEKHTWVKFNNNNNLLVFPYIDGIT